MSIINSKSILLFSLFCGICLSSQAQQFKFSYDASGNRIKRELIDLTDPDPSDPIGPEELLASENDTDGNEQEEAEGVEGSESSLTIFPNPTSDQVFVQFSEFPATSTGYYQLSSSSGEIISTGNEIQQRMKFDLSRYAAGYYLLKIQLNGEMREWVIVKD